MSIQENQMLTISQFAKLCNVSTQTLRIYDNEGILKPALTTDKHYRYYDITQSTTIYTIKQLQSLGFSLLEIKDLLNRRLDSSHLIPSLQKKLEALQDQAKSIQQKCDMLNKVISNYATYTTPPPLYSIMLERLPKKELFIFDVETITDDTTFMKGRQAFFKYLTDHYVDYTFQGIGMITWEKNLPDILTLNFSCDCMFIEKDEFNADLDLPTKTMPAGLYLSTYLHSYSDDKKPAKILWSMRWIEGIIL